MHTAEREFLPLPDEKRVVVEQLPPFERRCVRLLLDSTHSASHQKRGVG